MKFLRSAAVVVPAMIGAASTAGAQQGGPYAPLVLFMPAGARTLAMGNTGVAGRDDDVLFFNPAQLFVARGTSASLERYSANSAGGSLSSVTKLNNSAVAIGMRYVEYSPSTGSPDAPPGLSPFPGTRASALGDGDGAGSSVEASVGYARVFKTVRFGGVAKYVEDEVPGIRVGRAAFDLGLARDFFRTYAVGLSVQNIGKNMTASCDVIPRPAIGTCEVPPLVPGAVAPPATSSIYLPLRTTLGVSHSRQLGEFDLLATASASMLRKDFFIPSGGAELGYSWIDGYNVALRGGLRRPVTGESPVTAGAGITADRVSIDYALETLTGGRVAHRVGIRIR
ncbi:MAG: hypothetical protein ABI442_06200 [Gemmatimonadaceae bacterium]